MGERRIGHMLDFNMPNYLFLKKNKHAHSARQMATSQTAIETAELNTWRKHRASQPNVNAVISRLVVGRGGSSGRNPLYRPCTAWLGIRAGAQAFPVSART